VFGRSWQDGEATIVDVRTKKTSGDGMVSIHEFVADVRVAGASPFRTVMQEPAIATNFWAPSIGQIVRVHADVKRRKAKFDKGDPAVDAKAQQAAAEERFAASADAPPLNDFTRAESPGD